MTRTERGQGSQGSRQSWDLGQGQSDFRAPACFCLKCIAEPFQVAGETEKGTASHSEASERWELVLVRAAQGSAAVMCMPSYPSH